jgi:hypothetical protein
MSQQTEVDRCVFCKTEIFPITTLRYFSDMKFHRICLETFMQKTNPNAIVD